MDNSLLTLKNIEESFENSLEKRAFLEENHIFPYEEISQKNNESLLDFIKNYGVLVSLDQIEQLASDQLHAKDVVDILVKEQNLFYENPWDLEMITLAIAFLWSRKKTRQPMEFFDVHLHDGYRNLDDFQEEKAEECWTKAMRLMKGVLDETSLNESTFMEIFDNAYNLSEWIDDFNHLLFQTVNRPILKEFQKLTGAVVKQFENSQSFFLESFYLNHAQSFYHLGESLKANAVYQDFLTKRPKWKNGWLRWADNFIYGEGAKDYGAAVRIMEEGLEKVDADDKFEFLQRLKKIHLDEKDFEKLRKTDEELERFHAFHRSFPEKEDPSLTLHPDEIEDEYLKTVIEKNKVSNEDLKSFFD